MTHSSDLTYGAAKSLGLLLQSCPFDFDILFDKHILKTCSREQIVNYAGPSCHRILLANLVMNSAVLNGYKSFEKSDSIVLILKKIIRFFLSKILYFHWKNCFSSLLKTNQYDYVCFNSLILYPMLNKSFKSVMIVRELAKKKIKKATIERINTATGLIFIDDATEKRLINHDFFNREIPRTVLTNPFDMSSVLKVNKRSVREKYGISNDCVVFTIAGIISENKGVGFIASVFDKTNREDSVLLIVGKTDTTYGKQLMSKYHYNPRILFLGEESSMERVYAITDYILRGDSEFCTGRTMYEGLFSGCGAIIPGDEDDLNRIKMDEDFKQNIIFYKPRDKEILSRILSLINRPNIKIKKNSNTEEYARDFVSFVQQLM